MSASLPFDDSIMQIVQQFGLGPYDSAEEDEHGEDSNKRKPQKTLPDGGGGSVLLSEPEVFQSYPATLTTFASDCRDYATWLHWKALEMAEDPRREVNLSPFGPTPEFLELSRRMRGASGTLPGDSDRPPSGRKPEDRVLGPGVQSVSKSGLPSDAGNPPARSDYYDRMRQGLDRAPDPDGALLWPDEDSGAYASGASELPEAMKDEDSEDNYLGGLGNAWSGFVVEDQAGSAGFPSTDYLENANYPRDDRDGGGYIMASKGRVATNFGLVKELTDAFIKAFGKKDLTRRHVMAFLKRVGQSQYLASDIIRCLKLSHKIYVKDVLDEFPVARTASSHVTLAGTRDAVIDLEVQHLAEPDTARELRRCAASLSDVVALVERLGVSDG